ncbi:MULTISPECIES: structural protein [unclassified Pseudomonas]|uniref:structural protein n=1 Tax=unclassified Pseudomonas TaxID=196821 RepID=UPI00244A7C65|nr:MULTISPECIES: structural protein [unclassified Pseudomonas]MDH0894375.1 structural protein [Pseudomonas sp. GD03875]MDH1063330.1 structural protein [Pseudomonas sp. GD03985]
MRLGTPRGIRNNNPGNIERNATRWQGMALAQPDERFITFTHPVWGIRAIARVLITYQDKHNLRRVDSIIRRWAPPPENDTAAYVASVNQQLGIQPGQRIDVYDYHTMLALVRAIIRHENGAGPLPGGNWYGDALLAEGLLLAGIMPGVRHGEVPA